MTRMVDTLEVCAVNSVSRAVDITVSGVDCFSGDVWSSGQRGGLVDDRPSLVLLAERTQTIGDKVHFV